MARLQKIIEAKAKLAQTKREKELEREKQKLAREQEKAIEREIEQRKLKEREEESVRKERERLRFKGVQIERARAVAVAQAAERERESAKRTGESSEGGPTKDKGKGREFSALPLRRPSLPPSGSSSSTSRSPLGDQDRIQTNEKPFPSTSLPVQSTSTSGLPLRSNSTPRPLASKSAATPHLNTQSLPFRSPTEVDSIEGGLGTQGAEAKAHEEAQRDLQQIPAPSSLPRARRIPAAAQKNDVPPSASQQPKIPKLQLIQASPSSSKITRPSFPEHSPTLSIDPIPSPSATTSRALASPPYLKTVSCFPSFPETSLC